MPAKKPDDETRTFGRIVRELRRARGWTQDDLAAAIYTATRWAASQEVITRMERGERVTPPRDRLALAETFGVDPAIFDAPDGDPFSDNVLDEWRNRARLDAARDRLRSAARSFGELFTAFGEGSDDTMEREARRLVRDGLNEGRDREVERQNG